MRQADINRVNKAKEHLRAATILLSNIKWENITMMESEFIGKTKDSIQDADFHLDDILHLCREK
jgi:hypothetical protein